MKKRTSLSAAFLLASLSLLGGRCFSFVCVGNTVPSPSGDGCVDCPAGTFTNSTHTECLKLEDCTDGVDNEDEDTLVDCEDTECADDAICREVNFCSDSFDNDIDGLIDCNDSDCRLAPECIEFGRCHDGLDNDQDGVTDCADVDCFAVPDECAEVSCGDSVDNDQDSLTDCADADCSSLPSCSENCTNSIDDDADGLIDCNDPQCSNEPTCPFASGDANFFGFGAGNGTFNIVTEPGSQISYVTGFFGLILKTSSSRVTNFFDTTSISIGFFEQLFDAIPNSIDGPDNLLGVGSSSTNAMVLRVNELVVDKMTFGETSSSLIARSLNLQSEIASVEQTFSVVGRRVDNSTFATSAFISQVVVDGVSGQTTASNAKKIAATDELFLNDAVIGSATSTIILGDIPSSQSSFLACIDNAGVVLWEKTVSVPGVEISLVSAVPEILDTSTIVGNLGDGKGLRLTIDNSTGAIISAVAIASPIATERIKLNSIVEGDVIGGAVLDINNNRKALLISTDILQFGTSSNVEIVGLALQNNNQAVEMIGVSAEGVSLLRHSTLLSACPNDTDPGLIFSDIVLTEGSIPGLVVSDLTITQSTISFPLPAGFSAIPQNGCAP